MMEEEREKVIEALRKPPPQIVAFFEPVPWAEYVRLSSEDEEMDLVTPTEIAERYRCGCGYETHRPFLMLKHLNQTHHVSELVSVEIFCGREENFEQVDAVTITVPKTQEMSQFHGKRVLKGEEWREEYERLEKHGSQSTNELCA